MERKQKTPSERAIQASNQPGLDALQVICDHLNGKRELGWQPELRRLVSAWQASGPNLDAMLKADPGLNHKIMGEFHAIYLPTWTGRAHMMFSPHGFFDPNHQARAFFMMLTLSPEWEKLAGPCERCGKYYLKKRASQKVYCSRSCGNNSTAAKRTYERYQERRWASLKIAEQAQIEWCREWRRRRTDLGWKQWTAVNYHLSAKFLTRAVNKGDLSEPVQKGRK